MPLYNVHPLFTICVKSHVIGDSVLLLRNFRKTEKSPGIPCPTRESNPRPLVRQSHLRPLDQRGRQEKIYRYELIFLNVPNFLLRRDCVYKHTFSHTHITHDTQTRNNKLWITQRVFRAGIEPATHCTAVICPASASTVQSNFKHTMIFSCIVGAFTNIQVYMHTTTRAKQQFVDHTKSCSVRELNLLPVVRQLVLQPPHQPYSKKN
ncbi:hypothetical protein SFRURICE_013607 [Spodoptera frugiperda]|nr:hypothetical protein SFRURICE_013607 [Spodoptera frugiperda]